MEKRDLRLRRTVISAVLAALICVTTIMIQIPIYGTGGYVNLGDCFILIGAWLVANPWGAAAAAVGSALADIISGYAVFAPATFVIKWLMAFTAAVIAAAINKRTDEKLSFIGYTVSAVAAELIMTVGYFLYEWFMITGSAGAAAAGIIGNVVQGAVGAVSSLILFAALSRTKAVKTLIQR